jgi:diguanylate cyclase (GGDEF)-like protein/PAS domain S-box-containing protein
MAETGPPQRSGAGEERFRALFEHAPVGVALCSLDGRLREVNDALRRLLDGSGIEPDTAKLDDLSRRAPEDSAEVRVWRSGLADLVEGTVSVVRAEFPVRPRPDVVVDRWLQATAVRVDLGGLPFLLVHLEDVTSRHREQQQLRRLAWHDPATGLANRILVGERLDAALARFHDGGQAVGVLYLDIDDFKEINDRYGHDAGDRVLGVVADRLRAALRVTDTAGRLGGDEFCVIADVPDADSLAEVVRRVRAALGPPVGHDTGELSVTVSVGMALSEPGDTAESVMARADGAMYRDKGERRDERPDRFAVTDLRPVDPDRGSPLPVAGRTLSVH